MTSIWLMKKNAAVLFMTMVHNNFEGFTHWQVEKAKKAQELQSMMGNPLQRDFEAMVYYKLIDNLSINANDAKHVSVIFWPDLTGIRGKKVRWPREHVDTEEEFVVLPQNLLTNNSVVTLCADVVFGNWCHFLFLCQGRLGCLLMSSHPIKLLTY